MIGLLRKKRRHFVPESGHIDAGGRTIPVRFRVHARARRMILRVDAQTGEAIVTLPTGMDRDTALQFAEERGHWIIERLNKALPSTPFMDGAIIPFLGVDHVIRHHAGQRAPVSRDAGQLLVGGRPEHLSRRLEAWLKKEARRVIESRVIDLSARIDQRHGRITIRDTRSRWGSCSSTGSLNFSWRLVLAPEWVLDYVVAHEVAHLAEHNHGPAFWAIVGQLNDDAVAARRWLGKHGETLHRYG